MTRTKTFLAFLPFLLAGTACSSQDEKKTDSDYEAEVATAMHDTLVTDIQALHAAAEDMAKAAPAPSGRGWDATEDATAIDDLTKAWLRARSAYERTEGAIAPLFPDIDRAIDERYEGFLEALGSAGDPNLFDDQGVTGMHAIERIVFAKTTPQKVIDTEATLPGYVAAAWPSTEQEAADFKTKLCARLVTDTETLLDQWRPARADIALAYQGLVDLMAEQAEKVNKAASEEEESRYSERTMADIRDNLAGTKKIYAIFRPWLLSKAEGDAIDADVEKSFDDLGAAYDAVPGDAFPELPATWSSENPSTEDLATPFGVLFTAVHHAVDPQVKGSTVEGMGRAADALGLSRLVN
ncbi:MAG TPA: imelysin family protein [Polyangiaceae bacterium]|nr:imelysin family protein [Polyangiaceae bacterium]